MWHLWCPLSLCPRLFHTIVHTFMSYMKIIRNHCAIKTVQDYRLARWLCHCVQILAKTLHLEKTISYNGSFIDNFLCISEHGCLLKTILHSTCKQVTLQRYIVFLDSCHSLHSDNNEKTTICWLHEILGFKTLKQNKPISHTDLCPSHEMVTFSANVCHNTRAMQAVSQFSIINPPSSYLNYASLCSLEHSINQLLWTKLH